MIHPDIILSIIICLCVLSVNIFLYIWRPNNSSLKYIFINSLMCIILSTFVILLSCKIYL